MALETYRKKRNFKATPEPRGRRARRRASGALKFVVQKHAARQLHYDFRLELNGVLLSWAVPKGPSLDPRVRRLALHVEDHPIEYGAFEGIIPARQYGAGTVMLWDRGVWVPREEAAAGYRSGRLKFELRGKKLKGGWMLVRSRSGKYGGDKSWLLIKENDAFARPENGAIVENEPDSVATGRTLDEIASSADRTWHSSASVADNVRRGAVRKLTSSRRGRIFPDAARTAALPAFLAPELATLVKEPPTGSDWVHEMKLDGYRILCRIEDGDVRLYTRNRNDWTSRLPGIAKAAAGLKVESAWLDGEIVVLLPSGLTSFQRLQNALSNPGADDLRYQVFDLPYLDGRDLRQVPLVERKRLLEKILQRAPRALSYGSHVAGSGEAFYSEACGLRLEGVVSKKAQSAYRAGRTRDWLKIKCGMRQEMVIGGFTEPAGSRQGLGALLLGVYDADGALRYSGKVGTGFDGRTLLVLRRKLDALTIDRPAFANPPRGAEARGVHWVRPRLVGEIAFTEWTDEGTLRHPSFQGLREDKAARDVRREKPATMATGSTARTTRPAPRAEGAARTHKQVARGGPDKVVAGVALSNATKLLYPEVELTKQDVARYYEEVAERLLPHIRNRPLSLVRCPNGWERQCFYQKYANETVSGALERVRVEESDGSALYMMANTTRALVTLAQMGVLEVHPWGSTAKRLARPDRVVFDIDPDDRLPWSQVAAAARDVRKLLDQIGLSCFLKTTGGKGLHVVVPIRPTLTWEQVKAFSRGVADLLVRTFPDRFTAQMSKAKRTGKVFVDYLRNTEGATAIAPYSLRARARAPVALPIGWHELRADVRFDHFNLRNVPARLKRLKSDPWADFFAAERSLTRAMLKRIGVAA